MAETSYYDRLRETVITTDGLDTVPTTELETTLAVLVKWFPKPDYLPSVAMSPERVAIMDGAYWRYEACKQLAGLVHERKRPKDKNAKE